MSDSRTSNELRVLIQRLLLGIDRIATDDECIPDGALYDAYVEARAAIGHPIVEAAVPEGLEGRYQLLGDALAGEPWPPEEWVDSGEVARQT